jgi:hypothetical protein
VKKRKLVRIPVEKLLYKPNAPSGMNPLVVMSLTYFYRSNVLDTTPIVVRREGDNYRILDGRHRAVGSMIAGRTDVLAEIEEPPLVIPAMNVPRGGLKWGMTTKKRKKKGKK